VWCCMHIDAISQRITGHLLSAHGPRCYAAISQRITGGFLKCTRSIMEFCGVDSMTRWAMTTEACNSFEGWFRLCTHGTNNRPFPWPLNDVHPGIFGGYRMSFSAYYYINMPYNCYVQQCLNNLLKNKNLHFYRSSHSQCRDASMSRTTKDTRM